MTKEPCESPARLKHDKDEENKDSLREKDEACQSVSCRYPTQIPTTTTTTKEELFNIPTRLTTQTEDIDHPELFMSSTRQSVSCMFDTRLLHEPQFTWFTMLRSTGNASIIYTTCTLGFCYVNLLEKVLTQDKRNAKTRVDYLVAKHILQPLDKSDLPNSKIRVLRRYEKLSEYHLKKIQFYSLTEEAKEFFSQVPWGDGIIAPDVIKRVRFFGSELQKTHERIEQEKARRPSSIPNVKTYRRIIKHDRTEGDAR